jgi:hypothetical protein
MSVNNVDAADDVPPQRFQTLCTMQVLFRLSKLNGGLANQGNIKQ